MPKREQKVIILEHVSLDVAETTYDEGEIGPLETLWVESGLATIKVRTPPRQNLQAIVEVIRKKGPQVPADPKDWIAFDDGRLDCSYLSDAEGYPATAAQVAAHTHGKARLYNATVYCLVKFGTIVEPYPEEIAAQFGVETYD